MEVFVRVCTEYEWVGRKSLFLVSPGEGLDAKALELADTIGFDAGTMKVCDMLLISLCFHTIAGASMVGCGSHIGRHRGDDEHAVVACASGVTDGVSLRCVIVDGVP